MYNFIDAHLIFWILPLFFQQSQIILRMARHQSLLMVLEDQYLLEAARPISSIFWRLQKFYHSKAIVCVMPKIHRFLYDLKCFNHFDWIQNLFPRFCQLICTILCLLLNTYFLTLQPLPHLFCFLYFLIFERNNRQLPLQPKELHLLK